MPPGPPASRRVLPRRQRADGRPKAAAHAEGRVGTALRVHVDGSLDPELVPEGPGEVPVAVADEDELGAGFSHAGVLAVHLHRLLAAKEAAEVAGGEEDGT